MAMTQQAMACLHAYLQIRMLAHAPKCATTAGMVLGTRPGAADESVALTSDASVHVPHELPGQDPEGGSEVNFALGDESSSATATPRAELGHSSSGVFNEGLSADGQPQSPQKQIPALGGAEACAPGGSTSGGGGVRFVQGIPASSSTDGLGGSWQDLQALRSQSLRTNPLLSVMPQVRLCICTRTP